MDQTVDAFDQREWLPTCESFVRRPQPASGQVVVAADQGEQ